jgi:hypothetical protein
MLLWAARLGVSGLSACSADYPAGAIVCNESSECPQGMSCLFERGSDDGRCFFGGDGTQQNMVSEPSAPDASSSISKPRDAGSLADSGTDTGSSGSGDRGGSGGDQQNEDAGTVRDDAEPRDAGSARDSDTKDSGAQAGSDKDAAAAGSGGTGGAQTPAAGSGGTGGAGGADTPAAGSGGASEPQTPCEDPARECDPADVDMGEEPCGLCDTGARTHSRSCNATSCRWEAWSPWTECADPAECSPGTSQSRSSACPGCGSKSQTRVCSQTTCKYEAWQDASSCSWCDACGELVYCDTPDDVFPNRGTWCRPQNGCSNEQAWGRCLEILEENTCKLHEPRYIGN